MSHRLFLISVSSLAIVACSESSPTPPPTGSTPPPPPPASTTLTTTGTITGFGSIVVNGVHYEVDNGTVVAIEGEPVVTGDDGPLRLGMVVSVNAREQNGQRTANRIEYDEELRGPARQIVPDSDEPEIGQFSVNGQSVIVDFDTVLSDDIGDNDAIMGIDIRDLEPVNFPGNAPIVVEVSGYVTDAGVVASRIERVNAAAGSIGNPGVDDDEFEVKGIVDTVADDGSTFSINDATFQVVAETVFLDGLMPDETLVGQLVEVKFDEDAGGNLIAVEVESEEGDDNDEDEFEIEGILQEVDTGSTPNTFVMNGETFETTDASPLSGLVGKEVEIEGTFDANGLIVITSVEIEIENTIKHEDRIASIDTQAGTFTTRLGLVIEPTTAARVQDAMGNNGDRLPPQAFLNRLAVDDFIRAFGYTKDNGDIVWTRIQRRERDTRQCRLRGPLDEGSIADPDFSILGVAVDTNGLGFDGFEYDGVGDIGRDEFFATIDTGDIVQAKSDPDGTGCSDGALATAATGGVEIEDEVGDDGGDDTGDPNATGEISGVVSALDAMANSFVIAGRTITVTPDTLIDDSFIERARMMEVGSESVRFGDLPETLDQLLMDGDNVVVEIDADGNALSIEDNAG